MHAHDFFGNVVHSPGARAYARLRHGGTGCRGALPRAAYWTPVLFDAGKAVTPDSARVALRSAGRPVARLRKLPAGLKMLAGNAPASAARAPRTVRWGCTSGSVARMVNDAPRCGHDQRLTLQVTFPACWNGKALDSADHRAHMAYPTASHCPVSHPVALPELVLTVTYPTAGGRAVTLASGSAQTAHADVAVSGVKPKPTAPAANERGTSLSGRVLQLNGRPLANVTLELAGHQTRTDRRGTFSLTGIPAGHRVLVIDGATANRHGRRFGRFEAGVDLRPRRKNVLPYTSWMPQLDVRHEVRIPATTSHKTVITTPRVPGLEIHLPAGTRIRDASGQVVHKLGLTAIPIDKPPFPLPMLGVKAPIYFTVQPGGAYVLPKGARVIYPNYTHEPAGQKVEFWNYDPGRRGWHVYGHGHVTPDGRQVVPDRGVRIYRFTGAMFNAGDLPPDQGPPPDACKTQGAQGGDPVDCATGLFLRHDTDLQLPDVTPIDLTRTYRQNDTEQRAFGVGWSMPYDMFLWSREQYKEVDLILPDGGRVHYVRTSPGTSYSDAVFESTSTPTAFYQSTITWASTGGWRLRLKDGTTLEFPSYKPVSAIVDRFGNRTTITREDNKITQVTSPHGRWISFDHDADGRITQARDNIGRTVSYRYDGQGRLRNVKDAAGGVTVYDYDGQSRMKSVTNPLGIRVVHNDYDAAGRVEKQTLADGAIFKFDYTADADGRITETTVTDPRGIKRTATFNAAGYLLTDTRAVGRREQQVVSYERGSGNLPTIVTDPLGRRTKTTYDPNGNPSSITRLEGTPEAVTTHMTWDPRFSQLTSLTDPLEHKRSFSYDDRGALTGATDALKRTTTVVPDSQGRPKRVTDAAGATVAYDYTGGDLTMVTDPLGRTTRSWFDPAGRAKYLTDPAGNVATLAYDALNRVTKTQDVLDNTTAFDYDANGNLKSVTDARGGLTEYDYDRRDQLETRTDPLGRIEHFHHDPAGNLDNYVDRKGQTDVFLYDGLNRRTDAAFGSGDSDVYIYDDADRLTDIITTKGATTETVSRVYDALDRLEKSTTPAGSVGYHYDAADRLRTLVATGQPDTTYIHTDADELKTITRGSDTVGFTYDDAGRRKTTVLPNNVHKSYDYDPSGRTTNINYTANGVSVGEFSYAYDGAGRRSRTDTTLAPTDLPDAVASATYDDANRLTKWGAATLTYDANGNLTSDETATFDWNNRHQLESVTRGTAKTSYQYDALGRRSQRKTPTATTDYLYDGINPIQEIDQPKRTQLLTGTGTDEYLARIDAAGTHTFLTDDLGSTAALIGPTSEDSTRYAYEPFGRTTSTGTGTTTAFQYTGRENDDNDLYYYRARYYNPAHNRFISEDPIGFRAGDPNLYRYATGNPVDLTDPTGTDTVVIITRDYGVGSHAAMYVANAGQPVLFDPLGTFNPPGGRGSGGFLDGKAANLGAYIRYQKSTGSNVETYRFRTTAEEENALVERISPSDTSRGEGQGGYFTCAIHVSSVLQGIGPFGNLDTYGMPGSLADALNDILSPTDFASKGRQWSQRWRSHL